MMPPIKAARDAQTREGHRAETRRVRLRHRPEPGRQGANLPCPVPPARGCRCATVNASLPTARSTRGISSSTSRSFGPEQQYQTDTYILKGKGSETWHSRFTYHGFQYVEVTGFPGRPALDSLRARFIHSAVPKAGEFACSNPLLNRIQRPRQWSFLSNLQGIPTDCPHREKNGWTGDAHLACEQAQFNFFPAPVHQKWLNDLGDEQKPERALPGIVPTSGWGYAWGNGPAWDSAFLLIPYYEYLYYGDTENFRRHYDGMKRYVDYLTPRPQNGIVNIGLNDWAPWKTRTEAGITDTAYYYVDTKIVALAAGLLGKQADARKYNDLAADIKAAFNHKFFQSDTALYDNGSQTALSCALYQGLVEPENKARVLANLVAAVEKANSHIDTGILGAKYLLNTLLENGRADVAYRMDAQKRPAELGLVAGARGDHPLGAMERHRVAQPHHVRRRQRLVLQGAWPASSPTRSRPASSTSTISPDVVGDLTSARGEYDSIRGKIVSDWQADNGEFRLRLTIPANSTATVSLPIARNVLEEWQTRRQSPGVKFLRTEGRRNVFEVGSGNYHLSGTLAR